MTWPVTLARLPRAGAISKPHDHKKQNVQKWRAFWKNDFNGEQFQIFKPKSQNLQSSYGEQNKWSTRPQGQNLNMNHVDRKNLTEAKLKKAFRRKLFELCKTRTKFSSPHLIKFM